MKLTTATMALLAQTALCDAVLQAREAKVTAAAALPLGLRAEKDECSEGKTACGDGNGCCPRGAQCTQSKGVGVCAGACDSATLFCDFGKGVKLCCQPGASCDYSQSVCTQHRTDSGGVWTPVSTSSTTTSDGSPLPTAPVFSSTSDAGDTSSSETATTESTSAEETSQSSSGSSAPATDGSGTSSGGATATKTPKDSGSAIVASWSLGVLAVVFGVMAAL